MMVRLLLGIYRKARKPSLYLTVEGVRTLARRLRWQIAFRYIPRQLNAIPDDMCRRAEASEAIVEYVDGAIPADAPQLDLDSFYRVVDGLAQGARQVAYTGSHVAPAGLPGAPAGDPIGGAGGRAEDWATEPDGAEAVMAAWDDRLRGVPCGTCTGLDHEEDMLVCDRCGTPHHQECQPHSPAGDGPWYCGQCRGTIRLQGSTDPVEDLELLDYLFRGILPDDLDVSERVRRLAGSYRARGQELETLANPYGLEAL
ncbi:MAG TPA: PHD finger domain-containing protein [Geothrix sp.]|nr:PHD finger domain-containing protein [Geothrix sp.]